MKIMTTLLISGIFLMCGCSPEESNATNVSEPEINETPSDNDGKDNTGNNDTYLPDGFNFDTRTVTLNSGYEMPIIGIGTYLLNNAQAEESVYNALKVGMRLIDTADIYGNEVGVGRGIRRAMNDFGIKREEIFVTSKLWTSQFAQADEEVDERLERLGLDYIDLLLLHHTAPNDIHAYQAMGRGVKDGKIRSIGISNFYEDDIDRLMKNVTITPAVIQNETHPDHQSRSVKNHIASLGTVMESWFPLGGKGTGIKTLAQNDVIRAVAAAHEKTPYQVLLRWQLQSGNVAIPGSTNAAHIAEDFDIFDFELTPDEMKKIDDLDQNHRFASY
ncbi:MAG: aldo/keto reductase [Muribaculaceae bacterium]|nr:aldo/keto reductase [Muribaculaceae bacterium]